MLLYSMPYSDIWHIQVHICAYMWEIYVSVYVHLYGYTCEGVRELGRRVTGCTAKKVWGLLVYRVKAIQTDVSEPGQGPLEVSGPIPSFRTSDGMV